MLESDGPVDAECPACSDTGWWVKGCDGVYALCGRRRRHLPHDYAVPCPCRPINRTWNEKQGSHGRAA